MALATQSTTTLVIPATAIAIPRLNAAAKIGLIHDTAEYFESHSGADYEALALGLITQLGAYLGPRSWVPIPAPERQYPKLYGVVVGPSSSGKEQVLRWPMELLSRVDPDWNDRVLWGISSGEGLIQAVQSMDRDGRPGEPGQALIALGEIGQLLAQLKREGSATLPILLRSWDDDGRLQVPTRKDPLKLDRSHIGISAATTARQFKRGFSDDMWEAGFGNRWLVSLNSGTKRPSSYSPALDSTRMNRLVTEWQHRLGVTQRAHGEMTMSPTGQAFWDTVVDALWQTERDGGDRAGRIRAKVLRLALIYAVGDGVTAIDEVHLRAGVAWLDYHSDAVEYLLGSTLGSDAGDVLVQYFQDHPESRMSRSEITAVVFGGRIKSADLDIAIKSGIGAGRIQAGTDGRRTRGGGIRPVTVYEGG